MSWLWIGSALGLLLGLLSPAAADHTRLQDAMERKGVLLRRLTAGSSSLTYGEAGQRPEQRWQVSVDGVAVYEPLADDPQKSCVRGVRLSILAPGLPRLANQFPELDASWLDLDECTGVLKALRHVHAAIARGGEEYPQFRLVTRSGLTITTMELAESNRPIRRSVSVSYRVGVATYYANLSSAELEQLIGALDKATAAAQAVSLEK